MRSKRAEHSSPGGVTLQQSRWENHLPQPASHASFDAVQGRIGFPGCKHTLPAYVDFLIYQYPQVLLFRAALSPFSAYPVFVHEIALTLVQHLAADLVELHEVHWPTSQSCQGPSGWHGHGHSCTCAWAGDDYW